MSKPPRITLNIPGPVERALRTLGENLRISRLRRKESLRTRAERMNISVPTLRRMEMGDATVSMAVYAVALWLMQREGYLPRLADPGADAQALALELSSAGL